jgi:c-di-GMP-binding flagellar brake protein YcgR
MAELQKTPTYTRITRLKPEIARVMEVLSTRQLPVTSILLGGELQFVSQLIYADPAHSHLMFKRSPDAAANDALLRRPRCTFESNSPDWHIEFSTGPAALVQHEGEAAIRTEFPDVLTTLQRRASERINPDESVSLRCVADAGGFVPFEASIVDIGLGGLCFLAYPSDIALEPGTILSGSRILFSGEEAAVVDLEVCYSELINRPDGSRALRSGCKIVGARDSIERIVQRLLDNRMKRRGR